MSRRIRCQRLPDPWLRWARPAFQACLVTVLLLTLTPLSVPNTFPDEDKLHHLVAFATLCVLACAGWSGRWWQVCLPLSALGALIEVIQIYVPNRSADVADWAADTAGVILGWYIYPACRAWFEKRFARANS